MIFLQSYNAGELEKWFHFLLGTVFKFSCFFALFIVAKKDSFNLCDIKRVVDFFCNCSPTSDGAACAIVASEDFVRKHDLMENAVEIVAQAMSTDLPGTFSDKSYMTVVSLYPVMWRSYYVKWSCSFNSKLICISNESLILN